MKSSPISRHGSNRVQLTSDGHRAYLDAVETVFGEDIDYAMLQKIYGSSPEGEKRYSPDCIGCEKRIVTGEPTSSTSRRATPSGTTSPMRMHMRRFARLLWDVADIVKVLEDWEHRVATDDQSQELGADDKARRARPLPSRS